jgi:hypothetical protein
MLRNSVVNRYNIELVDYYTLFCDSVGVNFLDQIYDLNLIVDGHISLTDQTVKRSLTHNIIAAVCEYIMTRKLSGEQPVFLYSTVELQQHEILKFITWESFSTFHEQLERKLNRVLGLNFHQTAIGYDEFQSRVIEQDGECTEHLISICNQSKPHSLHQLYRFVTDNGLDHIKHKFFTDTTFKKVLI